METKLENKEIEPTQVLIAKAAKFMSARSCEAGTGRYASGRTDQMTIDVRDVWVSGRKIRFIHAAIVWSHDPFEATIVQKLDEDGQETGEPLLTISSGTELIGRLLELEWFDPRGANYLKLREPDLAESVA